MAHIGTLTITDEQGREKRIPCEGGLDSHADTGGGLRIEGLLSVDGEALEDARELMERARGVEQPMASFSGEVYTVDRRDTRLVENLPVRIEAVDETGNVRVESDEVISA